MKENNKDLKIVFMGTPEFAVGPLEALIQAGYNIAAVITVPDKPKGRGLKIQQSEVKKYTTKNTNIPILQPVSLKDPAFIEQMKEINADLFVVVAFRMLPKVLWSLPPLGTFNLHAALLPKYRGAAPINWAIINGEKETGVTTFLIDEKIDTGRILFQEKYEIKDDDNIGTVYDKLMAMGSELVVRTTACIASGDITPIEQKEDDTSNLYPAPKLNKENRTIDWKKSSVDVHNLIRGLDPYPAALSTLATKNELDIITDVINVKIFRSSLCDDENKHDNAGKIETDGHKYLRVLCGKGAINILELQLAGKKRLEIKAFLAGWKNKENSMFI